MADEIQQIASGDNAKWLSNLNGDLEKLAAFYKGAKLSNWSKDGITLINGAVWQQNTFGYRTLKIGDATFVELDLKITSNAKTTDIGRDLVQLPDNIAPENPDRALVIGVGTWVNNVICPTITTLARNKVSITLEASSVPGGSWKPGFTGYAIYMI